MARKLQIKPDGVLSFRTGEHVFQFCKEKATWDFMFSLHLAPTSYKSKRLWNREMSLESNDKADMIHEPVRREETGNEGAGCWGHDIIALAFCLGPGKM